MKRWRVTVHKEAEGELRALRESDPCGFEEVSEVMQVLAHEPDPRCPRNRRLNVSALHWDTNGEWFRARTFRGNYRVVFRVLQQRGERIVEIHKADALGRNAPDQALQVVRAAERASVYRQLKALHKRLKAS